jgi:putative N6-adenine-specific DNA methylase
MSTSPSIELYLPAAAGVEDLLAEEVERITGHAAECGRNGVWVRGDARTAMMLNLHSRLAQRVLWPVAQGPYRDEHDLYDLARRVDWTFWFNPTHTFKIDAHAQRSPLHSLNFAVLRIKDAVCDRLRESAGERPSVDTQRPDVPLVLYAGPDYATLYVDTSGESLFKRGWRDARGGRENVKGEAPLKETLAAAMLAAARWQGHAQDGPLLDPCCGAGTIAIEAAQLACGIAPGLHRRFAFERQLPFRPLQAAWQQMRREAQAAQHEPAVAIFAGDVSFRMTDFAQRNAERAGVAHAIQFKAGDALQRPPPVPAGTLMLNPPYGERLAPKGQGQGRASMATRPAGGRDDDAGRSGREGFEGGGTSSEFFSALAAHWKKHYAGWTAWLLSPDLKLPSAMRLKESARVPLWNGPIECRLFRFDLVAGGHRGPRTRQSADANPDA